MNVNMHMNMNMNRHQTRWYVMRRVVYEKGRWDERGEGAEGAGTEREIPWLEIPLVDVEMDYPW